MYTYNYTNRYNKCDDNIKNKVIYSFKYNNNYIIIRI